MQFRQDAGEAVVPDAAVEVAGDRLVPEAAEEAVAGFEALLPVQLDGLVLRGVETAGSSADRANDRRPACQPDRARAVPLSPDGAKSRSPQEIGAIGCVYACGFVRSGRQPELTRDRVSIARKGVRTEGDPGRARPDGSNPPTGIFFHSLDAEASARSQLGDPRTRELEPPSELAARVGWAQASDVNRWVMSSIQLATGSTPAV